jgi:high-affinity Fe2+/Pb2+ permease
MKNLFLLSVVALTMISCHKEATTNDTLIGDWDKISFQIITDNAGEAIMADNYDTVFTYTASQLKAHDAFTVTQIINYTWIEYNHIVYEQANGSLLDIYINELNEHTLIISFDIGPGRMLRETYTKL